MNFVALNIGKRLSLGFGLLIATVVALAAMSYSFGHTTSIALSDVRRAGAITAKLKDSFLTTRAARAVTWYYTTSGDESAIPDIAKYFDTYSKQFAALRQEMVDPKGIALAMAYDATVQDFKRQAEILIALRRSGASLTDAAARQIFADMIVKQKAYATSNDRASAYYQQLSDAAFAEGDQAISQMNFWSLTVGVSSSILAVAFAVAIARSITRPIGAMTQAMGRIAAGDFACEVPGIARKDEVGTMAKAVQVFKNAGAEKTRLESEAAAAREAQDLSRERQAAVDTAKAEDLRFFVDAIEAAFGALEGGDLTVRIEVGVAAEFEPIRAKFNSSVTSLEQAIGSVIGSVGSIQTGLGHISMASSDLSQRTEQQAASLEETVAALSEVMRGVNDTAEDAGQAQASVIQTKESAERGSGIVSRAVQAMNEIEASSERIGRIIGVIDEIAFQTNLLALNAGVEAARAGEAGRGFAVVAQEVRGLAQRSAEAAKEIKQLISASSNQVETGVKLVVSSGQALDDIVSQVGTMTAMVQKIASSAREQAVSLREVASASDQMDKVTQQNAAMVEETTVATQSLEKETEALAQLTAQFRTHAPTGLARRAAASPSVTTRPVRQIRTTAQAVPVAAEPDWAAF